MAIVDRVGHLILYHLRRLAGIFGVDDHLNVGDRELRRAGRARRRAETVSGLKAILGVLSLGRGIPFPRCRSILDEDWW